MTEIEINHLSKCTLKKMAGKDGGARMVNEMSEDIGREKLKMIIPKVAKLGWLQKLPNGEIVMNLADVEKTIIAIFDDFEMSRIDGWCKNIPTPEKLPELKILELVTLHKQLESQAKILGSLFRKESCLWKVCPFPNIPREPKNKDMGEL